MDPHASNHPGNASNRFQHNRSVAVPPREEFVCQKTKEKRLRFCKGIRNVASHL
jgi:hypothetical protein